jgi:hypothetical protein
MRTAPPPSDAIEAVALAAALAENALESERKSARWGLLSTPRAQHLYDVDDPCFGFVESSESSWSYSGGGDWGDYTTTTAARQLLRGRSPFRGEWEHIPRVLFWRAHALRSKSDGPFQKK